VFITEREAAAAKRRNFQNSGVTAGEGKEKVHGKVANTESDSSPPQ